VTIVFAGLDLDTADLGLLNATLRGVLADEGVANAVGIPIAYSSSSSVVAVITVDADTAADIRGRMPAIRSAVERGYGAGASASEGDSAGGGGSDSTGWVIAVVVLLVLCAAGVAVAFAARKRGSGNQLSRQHSISAHLGGLRDAGHAGSLTMYTNPIATMPATMRCNPTVENNGFLVPMETTVQSNGFLVPLESDADGYLDVGASLEVSRC